MTTQASTDTAITLDYLLKLRQHGYGVIPLRERTKAPPPPGLTGDDGHDLSEAQIRAAHAAGSFHNVAIRLPRGVVGLDVDAYDGKTGAHSWQSLHAAAAQVGAQIPHTVRITSRADDDPLSGIRLFRAAVPDDRKWLGGLPGLEIIHTGHRYAVLAPSIHPSGRQYMVLDEATGELLDAVPSVRALPRLPDAVIAKLTEPRTPERESGPAGTARQANDDPARGYSNPCQAVAARATKARNDLTGDSGSRHGATCKNVMTLARLHDQGHTGALGALDELRGPFIHAVTSGGKLTRDVGEAQREYDAAVAGAWIEVAASPTPERKRGCCSENRYPLEHWEGPTSEASVTDTDDAQRDLDQAVRSPWDEPLTPSTTHGPNIDVSGLPPVVREIVEAVAAQSQTPREVVLAAALGTLAAATRGVWQVRVNDTWTENTTALWLLTLADSGERKDAGQRPIVKPLEVADSTIAAEVRRENRNRAAERKRLAAALKEIERGEGDPRNEAHLIEQEHNARPRHVPARPFSDVTTEALGIFMSTSGGAAAVFGTEGGAFQVIAGRYSDAGANTSLLNHAYDGEPYSDGRVKRAGVSIHRAALAWCTAVQPKVLAGYADQWTEGSGFLNRFTLFLPQSMVGRIDWDRHLPVPAHVSAAWAATVGGIHAAAWARYVAMTDDLPDTLGPVPTLSLEPDAAEAIRLYGKHLEPRKLPHTPYANLTGWLSKHPGRIVRIAALFALTDNPERTTVPLWAVESALTLAEPMIAHALTTYRVLRQTTQNEGAHRALEAVRALGTPHVSTRDVYERCKGQTSWVTRTADITHALEALADMGYLRGPYRVTTGKGGRPTELWAVHPDLRHHDGGPTGGPLSGL